MSDTSSGVAVQIEVACRELGLDAHELNEAIKQAKGSEGDFHRVVTILAQVNERLRAEVRKFRETNEKLQQREQAIAELLHSESPDKILHDLRNILNELMLLKAIAKTSEESDDHL